MSIAISEGADKWRFAGELPLIIRSVEFQHGQRIKDEHRWCLKDVSMGPRTHVHNVLCEYHVTKRVKNYNPGL